MKDNTNKIRKGKSVDFVDWNLFSTFLFIDKKQSKKASNYSAQKSRFNKLSQYFTIHQFNRKNFNVFISILVENKYSNSYINNFIKMGKLIDEYLNTTELVGYTYFKEKRVLYIDTLTPDEIVSLAEITIKYARNSEFINYRQKVLIYLLGKTGCRINEALGLKWDDVFTDYVLFRDTKNGDDRPVPIALTLYKLMNGLPKTSETVFDIKIYQEINKDLKRRAKECGVVKVVYCHLFRHSYISEMTKQKVPISYIARIVGHRNLETTNRYTHASLTDLRYMMNFHPLEKQEQSFDELTLKIKEFVEKLIDKSKFSVQVGEKKDKFSLLLTSY